MGIGVLIIGKSGSGKSTLIKLILKEEEPTAGNIIINGKDTTFLKQSRVPFLRRSMGVVFQDFRLLPDKTVYENVAFAQRVVGTATEHIRKDVPKILATVGLAEKYRSLPAQLSGGEQQRVALARALVNKPSIILADEPTGNLDPYNSKMVMQLLLQIHEKLGITMLIATHDKDVLEGAQARVFELKNK